MLASHFVLFIILIIIAIINPPEEEDDVGMMRRGVEICLCASVPYTL